MCCAHAPSSLFLPPSLPPTLILPPFLLPSTRESLSWELQSLLIKPVQRVLKYPLLLEKLLKATPQSHPEHRKLMQALEAAQQVAQDINEFKRRKDLGKGHIWILLQVETTPLCPTP